MRCFLAALFAAHAGTAAAVGFLRRSSAATGDDDGEVSSLVMLMSSRMEKKISYVEIKDGKAAGGVVLPLIDAGLCLPSGIAYDDARKGLFVADRGQHKIFHYVLKVAKCVDPPDVPAADKCKIGVKVTVEGEPKVLIEGVDSDWLTVDPAGNLYYTDEGDKSVNKLSQEVVYKLLIDEILPSDLTKVSEQVGEALTEASASEKLAGATGGADGDGAKPAIVTLYEAGPEVGTPAGIATDGTNIYWTNMADGSTKGTVVEGQADPKAAVVKGENGAPENAANILTKEVQSAYGVTETNKLIVMTGDSKKVYAVSRTGGDVYTLSDSMFAARGVVWDGDSTAFIADEGNNIVYSLGVGTLKSNVPLSAVISFHDVFGLALIKGTAPPASVQQSMASAFVGVIEQKLGIGMR